MESEVATTSKSFPAIPRGKHKKMKRHKTRFNPYPMTDVAESMLLEKFSSSGRTGRRNALPDVMDDKYAGTSTSGLPDQLDQLHLQISGDQTSEKTSSTKDANSKSDVKDNAEKASGS